MGKKKVPEINGSSMADISFMLLIFFLTATTMESNTGLFRMLPPYQSQTEQQDVKVLDKDLYVVLVNKDDKLMVEKKPMNSRELRKSLKEFLMNMDNNLEDKKYPGYTEEVIPGIGKVKVTKAIVSVQNDRGTSYEKFIEIQNEIVGAYNEVKDYYSIKYFRKPFKDLKEKQQDVIKQIIPQKISEAEPKNIGGK